jgi:plastocyanin
MYSHEKYEYSYLYDYNDSKRILKKILFLFALVILSGIILNPVFAQNPDTDGDGIPDSLDSCPTDPETVNGFQDTDGCPDVVPPPTDTDGDGIPDSLDSCPTQAETLNGYQDTDGCPDTNPATIDTDGDGISDSLDQCPTQKETVNGFADLDGCPDVVPPTDTDGDGISDSLDQCPTQKETVNGYQDTDGCSDTNPAPKDTDNDGILDSLDSCPTDPETVNGFQDTDGCPDVVPPTDTDGDFTQCDQYSCHKIIGSGDTDGDGISDSLDQCPTQAATVYGNDDDGCPDVIPPLDTDNDGISDSLDSCPTQDETVNGYQDTDGCPDVVPIPTTDDLPNEITIKAALGSGSPGCEVSSQGCFIPKETSVATGGKVIFSNTDIAAHTFTAGSAETGPTGEFDSGLVMPGSSYEWIPNDVLDDVLDVTFTIISPGLNVVSLDQVTPDANGDFATEFTVNPMWKENGLYTIKAEQSPHGNSLYKTSLRVEVINGKTSETMVTSQDTEMSISATEGSDTISVRGHVIPQAETGETPYFCMIHPWMTGTIFVGEGTYIPPQSEDNFDLQVIMGNQVYDLSDTATMNLSIGGTSTPQNVALEISDPSGTTVISRSFMVDSQGVPFEFKIDENSKTGTYKVVATTSDNGNTVTDTAYFKVKSQYNSFKITSVQVTDQQGNPSNLQTGEIGFIKVNLEASKSITTLVTVNLFDSDLTSIGIGSIKTTLSSGNSEIILSFMIPSDVAVGQSNIYVNAFSDWPSNGGIPLTGEISITENIE